MKFVRPLLFTLGAIAVIVAVGLTIALRPSVQRWALLRAAANKPGLKVELSGVAAGFSSAVLDGVRIERRGTNVTVAHLEVEYSLWPLVFGHRLTVHRLAVKGLLVDASHRSRNGAVAATAGGPAAAPAVLAKIKLPYELVLDDCQVEGRLLLPGASGQMPLEAILQVKGGKFSPGAEGALILTATIKNPAADASVGVLHAQVGLRATQTRDRNFSRVNLTALVDATGPALSEQNQLKIVTELVKGTAGENYSLSVDTLLHGASENLLGLHATLLAGGSDYTGQWTLKARNTQLEPFFLGLALPTFDARGEGHVVYAPATSALSLLGNLDAGASRLEVIDPAWRAIGPVKLQAQFDVTAEDAVARLRQLNVKLAGARPVLELSALQAAEVDFSQRRLRVGGVAAGEALNLRLFGLPLAWVAPFVSGIQISGGSITGDVSITGGSDRMRLRSVQPLQVDELTLVKGGETVLAKAALTLALDAVLTDQELQARFQELALRTPVGDTFKAQVTLTMPISARPAVSVQAGYSAELPGLLSPWLPKVSIKAAGQTEFSWADGHIEMRSLTTNVTGADGVFLFKAATVRPFVFDPATRSVVGQKSPADLGQIVFGRAPLDWLPIVGPGAQLVGAAEPGEFVLGVDGEKIVLRSVKPFRLLEAGLRQDGEARLTGLEVEASPSVEIARGNIFVFRTGDISVRGATGAGLMTGKGDFSQSPADGTRGNFTFSLDVPALASQPFFAGTQAVTEGRASGEVRATIGSAKQIEARLTVNGLVAREGGQLLPVANLSFRALIQEDGKMSVQAPLLLDRAGQRSDLNFSLELTPVGPVFGLEGKLTGDHLELADALAVASVFSPGAARAAHEGAPAPSGPPVEVVADKVAAWSRLKGQLMLDLKSVTSGKDWSMSGLTGLVVIEPKVVSLKNLEAGFGENSRLGAKGAILFGATAEPYRLTGDFSVTEFDVGRLFKALDQTKAPTVEGLFTVVGTLAGDGETVDRTLRRTRGQFDLTSRHGVFRGLQRSTGKVSMTSKAVEIGASVLGSLLGSEKATKAAEKVAGQAYFVDQLAQSFGEFNYDQMSLRLVRDDSLNVTLEDVSLISPEIRLVGKGTVTYVEGKSLMDQPLNVSLSLAGRGKIEQLLGKLRLLDGTKDEVGYARTKETVTLGGTLARPDPTAFFTRIGTAKLNDLLAPE